MAKGIVSVDHEGRAWPSEAAMCRAWGVRPETFATRVRKGWDVRRALTEPPRRSAEPATDPDGREWPSTSAMCRAWGVTYNTYHKRMGNGWEPADALGTPEDPSRGAPSRRVRVYDHEGRAHASAAAMCRAWGIPRTVYYFRLDAGWDLAHALTVDPALAGAPCVDPLTGRRYRRLAGMCRAHHVDFYDFVLRLEGGMDAAAALSEPSDATDPDGHAWPSTASMCRGWGTTLADYRRALAAGASRREALGSRPAGQEPLRS